ncbi:MAG: hypothetical protein WBA09_14450 [Candidatus Acidiferrum sp.]
MGSFAQLDHRATWNEVCEALAFSSLEATEFGRAHSVHSEVVEEFRDGVSLFAEEFAWRALANQVVDHKPN